MRPNAVLSWVAEIASLGISDEATELARQLLDEGAIPGGSADDALHIAIAAAQGADFLLTWNFRHITPSRTPPSGRKLAITFEKNYPHAILGWEESTQRRGRWTTTTARKTHATMIDYWNKNKIEDIARYRAQLGLNE